MFAALTLISLLAASTPEAAFTNWQVFTAPDASFSVGLPAVPTPQPNSNGGTNYVVEGDDIRFWVGISPLPAELKDAPAEDVLGAFATSKALVPPGFVEALRESLPGHVGSYPSMYVHLQGHVPGRPDYTLKASFVHRGSTLLVLGYAAPSERFKPALFDHMMASLKFRKSTTKKGPGAA